MFGETVSECRPFAMLPLLSEAHIPYIQKRLPCRILYSDADSLPYSLYWPAISAQSPLRSAFFCSREIMVCACAVSLAFRDKACVPKAAPVTIVQTAANAIIFVILFLILKTFSFRLIDYMIAFLERKISSQNEIYRNLILKMTNLKNRIVSLFVYIIQKTD